MAKNVDICKLRTMVKLVHLFLGLWFSMLTVASIVAHADLSINDIKASSPAPTHFVLRRHVARKYVSHPSTETSQRSTIVVSQSPNSVYKSIRDAVTAAPVGGTIIVGPGVYTESLILVKPVFLTKDSKQTSGTVLLISSHQPCVTVRTSGCHFSGISFEADGNDAESPSSAIDIETGSAQLANCDVSGGRLSGIAVESANSQSVIRACHIHNSGGAGIVIGASALPTIASCTFSANSTVGIEIQTGANPTITGCSVNCASLAAADPNSTSTGIIVDAGASCHVAKCDFFGGGNQPAINVLGGPVDFVDCHVHDFAQHGIVVENAGASASFTGCTIERCGGWGMLVFRNAQSSVANTEIQKCSLAMRCSQNGSMKIADSNWHDCSDYGLFVDI